MKDQVNALWTEREYKMNNFFRDYGLTMDITKKTKTNPGAAKEPAFFKSKVGEYVVGLFPSEVTEMYIDSFAPVSQQAIKKAKVIPEPDDPLKKYNSIAGTVKLDKTKPLRMMLTWYRSKDMFDFRTDQIGESGFTLEAGTYQYLLLKYQIKSKHLCTRLLQQTYLSGGRRVTEGTFVDDPDLPKGEYEKLQGLGMDSKKNEFMEDVNLTRKNIKQMYEFYKDIGFTDDSVVLVQAGQHGQYINRAGIEQGRVGHAMVYAIIPKIKIVLAYDSSQITTPYEMVFYSQEFRKRLKKEKLADFTGYNIPSFEAKNRKAKPDREHDFGYMSKTKHAQFLANMMSNEENGQKIIKMALQSVVDSFEDVARLSESTRAYIMQPFMELSGYPDFSTWPVYHPTYSPKQGHTPLCLYYSLYIQKVLTLTGGDPRYLQFDEFDSQIQHFNEVVAFDIFNKEIKPALIIPDNLKQDSRLKSRVKDGKIRVSLSAISDEDFINAHKYVIKKGSHEVIWSYLSEQAKDTMTVLDPDLIQSREKLKRLRQETNPYKPDKIVQRSRMDNGRMYKYDDQAQSESDQDLLKASESEENKSDSDIEIIDNEEEKKGEDPKEKMARLRKIKEEKRKGMTAEDLENQKKQKEKAKQDKLKAAQQKERERQEAARRKELERKQAAQKKEQQKEMDRLARESEKRMKMIDKEYDRRIEEEEKKEKKQALEEQKKQKQEEMAKKKEESKLERIQRQLEERKKREQQKLELKEQMAKQKQIDQKNQDDIKKAMSSAKQIIDSAFNSKPTVDLEIPVLPNIAHTQQLIKQLKDDEGDETVTERTVSDVDEADSDESIINTKTYNNKNMAEEIKQFQDDVELDEEVVQIDPELDLQMKWEQEQRLWEISAEVDLKNQAVSAEEYLAYLDETRETYDKDEQDYFEYLYKQAHEPEPESEDEQLQETGKDIDKGEEDDLDYEDLQQQIKKGETKERRKYNRDKMLREKPQDANGYYKGLQSVQSFNPSIKNLNPGYQQKLKSQQVDRLRPNPPSYLSAAKSLIKGGIKMAQGTMRGKKADVKSAVKAMNTYNRSMRYATKSLAELALAKGNRKQDDALIRKMMDKGVTVDEIRNVRETAFSGYEKDRGDRKYEHLKLDKKTGEAKLTRKEINRQLQELYAQRGE